MKLLLSPKGRIGLTVAILLVLVVSDLARRPERNLLRQQAEDGIKNSAGVHQLVGDIRELQTVEWESRKTGTEKEHLVTTMVKSAKGQYSIQTSLRSRENRWEIYHYRVFDQANNILADLAE